MSADKAFEALKDYDWGMDANVLKPIEDAINASHGNSSERASLEGKLLESLQSEISFDGKQMVCRYLRTIGTAKAVPALANLLADEKLSHMARYALERIPGGESQAALAGALGKVSGELKVGVLSSLGVRQEDASVATIAKSLNDSDPAVATAAAHALGAVRSPAAAKALSDSKVSGDAASAASDAKFACAESLLADGNNKEALVIYKSLVTGDPPKHVKLAATRGMLACAGK